MRRKHTGHPRTRRAGPRPAIRPGAGQRESPSAYSLLQRSPAPSSRCIPRGGATADLERSLTSEPSPPYQNFRKGRDQNSRNPQDPSVRRQIAQLWMRGGTAWALLQDSAQRAIRGPKPDASSAPVSRTVWTGTGTATLPTTYDGRQAVPCEHEKAPAVLITVVQSAGGVATNSSSLTLSPTASPRCTMDT